MDYIYDYDFKMLPRSADGKTQYLVFKKGIEIYYRNLLDSNPNTTFQKLDLELDNGVITQVLSTYLPHVVQFQYSQASPL